MVEFKLIFTATTTTTATRMMMMMIMTGWVVVVFGGTAYWFCPGHPEKNSMDGRLEGKKIVIALVLVPCYALASEQCYSCCNFSVAQVTSLMQPLAAIATYTFYIDNGLPLAANI